MAGTDEWEKFVKWTEREHLAFGVWMQQFEALDRKATAVVTLDGMLLALTAALIGVEFGKSAPLEFRLLLGIGMVMILVSAAASAVALWVRRFLTETIARAGGIDKAFESFSGSRGWKARALQAAIVTLVLGLLCYTLATLFLLA